MGLVALVLLLGCKARDSVASVSVPLDAGAESVPAGEETAIAEIERMLLAFVEERFDATALAHRDAHVKTHGCVTATVTVTASLPETLAVGLFA